MINFIKKHKKIFGILTFSILFIVAVVYFGEKERQQEQKQPDLSQNGLPSFSVQSSEGLSAGQSGLKELENLGEASRVIENEEGTKSFIYGKEQDPQPKTVIVDNNLVIFIRKRPDFEDPNNLSKFTDQYGQPDAELYTHYTGFNAYIYLEEGLVVLAGEGGALLELRYFVPTTLNNFLSLWGQDLSERPPPPPPLYY